MPDIVEILDTVPDVIQIISGAGIIGGGGVNQIQFVELPGLSAGQTVFNIPVTAVTLIDIVINQISYFENSTLTPPGSGIVVYDDVAGGYTVEAGDYAVIYFLTPS